MSVSQLKFTVVIPTFGRPDHLSDTLASVARQTRRAERVIVVDNNREPSVRKSVLQVIDAFVSILNIEYICSHINSGAVARNLGAERVATSIVAFLDDDVILEKDYYEKIITIFENDEAVIGAQGVDLSLVEAYSKRKSGGILSRALIKAERFFEVSSIVGVNTARVRPSLAVEHPDPSSDFLVCSEWISTCAGVFRKAAFNYCEFPSGFVKYSWNEYLFFSYTLFKEKRGKMVYTSTAAYRDVQTSAGRLPAVELVYMAEIYDYFVFKTLFSSSSREILIFFKSRVGKVIVGIVRALSGKPRAVTNLYHLIIAYVVVFINRGSIRRGDFSCYNTRFP